MDNGQMKKETLNIANCIELDKDKAKGFLNKRGSYRQPGVIIEKWKLANNTENYVAYLEKNKFSYSGILNSKLKREKYGINTFENGDKYIGNFENDKREGNGIYIHATTDSKEYIQTEMYIGNWKENAKYLNGMYIWLKEKKDSIGLEMCNLDVFLGDVEQDALKRGYYLSKVQNKCYAYFGKFNLNGIKNDEKAYFYDYSNDKVFCGKIQDNKFVQGHLLFKGKDQISPKLLYLEFDEKDDISNHINHDSIEEKVREEMMISMTSYREILLKEDYFNMVYNKTYEIKNLSEKNTIDISIFNDEKEYQKIVDLSSCNKEIKLFNLLENIQS